MDYLVRGAAIGCAVAAPLGPIGVLCARRALDAGFVAGFAAGLGAATADAFYAGVAAFALGAMTHALAAAAAPLHVAGAAALIVLGAQMLLAARRRPEAAAETTCARGFGTTLALTLANPATILSFAAIVASAAFGSHAPAPGEAAQFVAGVFLGSSLWWLTLAAICGALRRAIPATASAAIGMISGLTLAAFGIATLLRP